MNRPRTPEDDARYFAAVERLLLSDDLVKLGAPPFHWFVVIASIHLACRHPNYPQSNRAIAEAMVEHMRNTIAKDDPDLRELIDRGWDDAL